MTSPTDATSQTYLYFHGKCSNVFRFLVLPAQTFIAKTHFAMSTVLNHLHSLNSFGKKGISHLKASSQEPLLWMLPQHYNC